MADFLNLKPVGKNGGYHDAQMYVAEEIANFGPKWFFWIYSPGLETLSVLG